MKDYPSSMQFSFFLTLIFIFFTKGICMAMVPLDLKKLPTALDYTSAESWLVKPDSPSQSVDVFFVYPTVLFNDTDWLMDTTRDDMRAAAMSTIESQASVFKGQANIYAPMYRQMNLAGLGLSDSEAAPLQEIVHGDVWSALQHYLQYENNGRPFFLAGHSQGSMILTDLLLKFWGTTGVEKQLVAALLIGWSVTSEDLAANSHIRICESADQTGCIISYNSMAKGRQAAAPTLKKGAIAVNPLSWTTDGSYISAEENQGAVFFDNNVQSTSYPHFTSAQIVDGGLVVEPLDVHLVTVRGGHFPDGIYHAFDYSLFFENLKANIAERIRAYGARNGNE